MIILQAVVIWAVQLLLLYKYCRSNLLLIFLIYTQEWTSELGCSEYVHSTLLLLLLSGFSHVRLCVTPWTAAHQAPPSLGFSRQEHWSGLPFPPPVHESEKWKWSRSVMSDSATPWTAAYQAPLSMGFSRQEYWSGVPLPLLDNAKWFSTGNFYQSVLWYYWWGVYKNFE